MLIDLMHRKLLMETLLSSMGGAFKTQ